MKATKTLGRLIVGCVFACGLSLKLHAQQTATSVQNGTFSLTSIANEDVSGLSDFEVELKALELLPTIPAIDTPQAGTFWSAQHAPGSGSEWPPMPANIRGVPFWNLGDGIYLLDDRLVNYNLPVKSKTKLKSGGGGVHAMDAPSVPGDGGGDDSDDDSGGGSVIIPFSTNGLWLQILYVSNSLAYLNLMNATDSVYEIMSTVTVTNGVNNWNIETEVWPTNPAVMPFTVPELNRTNTLFIRAMDWTGIDANSNGIADWWEWKYFGNFNQASNADYDGDGVNNYDEFTNHTDPNKIRFSVQFTNNYVNANPASGAITILGGVPSYEAVLVNDTNLADAIWQPYTSSNVMASLNSGNGLYNVMVGLKGLPSDAAQTWMEAQLTLNTITPVLTVTNPASGTVSVPMIQLQGYSSAELASLSYDVSNATGIFTNYTGYVTGEFYDTNLMEFTTNYFQCYDVALTNGLNTITLHAVDVFGQVANTNFNVTLDYSGDTTPPALSVIWPHNGTYISGSSFTFQGSVDDATATVTAQIVDAGGDTNTVQGAVERDGKVSIGNLPVSAGANVLTVTATDAAGNSTTTNLTLIQSGVMVTMDPLSSDQANLSSVSVTGTISDTSSNVCIQVSGTNAYYLDAAGDWEADGVPVSPTGMAAFDVELYTNDPVNIGSQVFVQLQPAFVTLANFKQDSYYADPLPEHGKSTVHWNYAGGGGWSLDFNAGGQSANASSTLPPDGTNYTLPTVSYEYEDFYYGGGGTWYEWTGQFSPAWQSAQNAFDASIVAYQESVQTTVMIVPSGPKLPGVTKTYNVRACAMSFSDLLDDEDLYNIELAPGEIAYTVGNSPVPPGQLLINGKALVSSGVTNSDGSVWGTNSVSAMAGTLVPLYVTGANNDFTFNAEIVKDKLYWQNLVQAEIDAKSSVVIENYLASNGFMANRQNIQAVYAFYQNLFVNQTNFLWAGLAKLAGAPVYAGLSDAESSRGFIGDAYIDPFQQTIISMNIAILNDLAWQFEAYKNGGLDALQEIYAVDTLHINLDANAMTAWQEIDDGIQNNNLSEIQDGNKKLLQREQQQVLANGYNILNNMTGVSSLMSFLAKNPVPTGFDFSVIEPSGNICVYADRWDWITTPTYGMWWLWIDNYTSQQLEWVEIPLKTRASDYALFSLY